MIEVAIAISFMHDHSIIHRDIKPSNILVNSSGHAVLIDFGLSKQLKDNYTSTLCGTPEYLAPEQLLKKSKHPITVEYTKEVDLWAYGVTLFELLSGYNPFSSAEPMERYKRILKGHVSWPSYMSIFAREFIEKLLVVDAGQRVPVKHFKSYYLFRVGTFASVGIRLGEDGKEGSSSAVCAQVECLVCHTLSQDILKFEGDSKSDMRKG
eukprot:TRINITY_DN4802_c0_g1_i1.p1 TRINITY_DN4802_c0_g1~~TRINITY_DN4802_c0_g1_i1.p1  ORF type:complete len:209 (-),score=23.34 TRINITY_DN4802_c0_g1_i1:108-734(-)